MSTKRRSPARPPLPLPAQPDRPPDSPPPAADAAPRRKRAGRTKPAAHTPSTAPAAPGGQGKKRRVLPGGGRVTPERGDIEGFSRARGKLSRRWPTLPVEAAAALFGMPATTLRRRLAECPTARTRGGVRLDVLLPYLVGRAGDGSAALAAAKLALAQHRAELARLELDRARGELIDRREALTIRRADAELFRHIFDCAAVELPHKLAGLDAAAVGRELRAWYAGAVGELEAVSAKRGDQ